ncbi:YbfB/YjiJ family MFS transporter [Leucobacter allii]|uniref:YbfB/YjiJ family MFS transporter n=1 Tax=Leucobacter allii TaxID=2932247 RepID=A0ABY4FGX1_9MICO|nr:YbfB/YjiJ family MFS transporter [Leucobacter allii]UOQ55881.1 YbfB/YjiJ family MFS transporter [Leucobacter allii]
MQSAAIPPRPAPQTADWLVAVRAGAVLAAAIGVGRFVFTPILPLMEAEAGLSAQHAGLVATANYVGYLVGALLGIAAPRLGTSQLSLRASGIVLLLSLPAMTIAQGTLAWCAIRLVAGVASALVFIVAGNAILTRLTQARPQFVGWAYGGLGVGIALSGVLVALVGLVPADGSGPGGWRGAWWASTVLAAVLLALGWKLGDGSASPTGASLAAGATGLGANAAAAPAARPALRAPLAANRGRFGLLFASYTLEGAGYIIAGTFLVAAVHALDAGPLSSSVWTVVGLAVIPSGAIWTSLAARFSRATLVAAALLLQAVGIALPALIEQAWAGMVAAALFGATFMGITTLSLAEGRALGSPRAVALLTAGYSVGQIAGPLAVVPLLDAGYRGALLVGAGIVIAAAVAAAGMRGRRS